MVDPIARRLVLLLNSLLLLRLLVGGVYRVGWVSFGMVMPNASCWQCTCGGRDKGCNSSSFARVWPIPGNSSLGSVEGQCLLCLQLFLCREVAVVIDATVCWEKGVHTVNVEPRWRAVFPIRADSELA